ncbi:MAG: 4-hydroxythreonine-4-phosphate dehydrogenase PdxA [Syntrophales bacterium]
MKRNARYRPVIGITMGDAAGVGPEIIVKALQDKKLYGTCRPLIVGDRAIMERAAAIVKAPVAVRAIGSAQEALFAPGTLDCIDLNNLPRDLAFAVVDGRAGKAAYAYVERAVRLALRGELDAIATAPLNKEALAAGGCAYPGHTEILSALSGTDQYAMLLLSKTLRVIHLSTHVPLRRACDLVKKERVLRIIRLADSAVRDLGVAAPRIAVAGLNPHAGEGGLFGAEEAGEIVPAVAAARAEGIDAHGPVSADTVFYRAAVRRDFDIVVAMYHDQGHIPLKVLGFADGVNVTVGLPFVRTSVDHGTAFEVAGKGTADSRSMTAAIRTAAAMARTKRGKKNG